MNGEAHLPEQILMTHRLANGLQVVAQPMLDAESVIVAYSVRTGARDEQDPRLEGISHFLEHMLFKGTETMDRPQLDRAFTQIGAKRNGFTSNERTTYYVQVLPEHLERAVELLSAMMYPRLLEQEFEAEKGVILNAHCAFRGSTSALCGTADAAHVLWNAPFGQQCPWDP